MDRPSIFVQTLQRTHFDDIIAKVKTGNIGAKSIIHHVQQVIRQANYRDDDIRSFARMRKWLNYISSRIPAEKCTFVDEKIDEIDNYFNHSNRVLCRATEIWEQMADMMQKKVDLDTNAEERSKAVISIDLFAKMSGLTHCEAILFVWRRQNFFSPKDVDKKEYIIFEIKLRCYVSLFITGADQIVRFLELRSREPTSKNVMATCILMQIGAIKTAHSKEAPLPEEVATRCVSLLFCMCRGSSVEEALQLIKYMQLLDMKTLLFARALNQVLEGLQLIRHLL